jgi:hypothetical protein
MPTQHTVDGHVCLKSYRRLPFYHLPAWENKLPFSISVLQQTKTVAVSVFPFAAKQTEIAVLG